MVDPIRSLTRTQAFGWLVAALFGATLLRVLVIPMLGHAGGHAIRHLLDASPGSVRESR